MEHEFVDGRLLLHLMAEERDPILHRLRRIEGQVRGLQQMVELASQVVQDGAGVQPHQRTAHTYSVAIPRNCKAALQQSPFDRANTPSSV